MTFGFKLALSFSVGRDGLTRDRSFQMSDKAKRLAEEVNKRQAGEQIRNQLQLHKAEILRAKAHPFWNNFAIVFRQEVTDFNNHLHGDEHRVDTFDDSSEPYIIKLRGGKSGAQATCAVDIPGQRICVTGNRPAAGLKIDYRLTVDDEDNIQIRDGSGGGGAVVAASDVAIKVLEFFAQ